MENSMTLRSLVVFGVFAPLLCSGCNKSSDTDSSDTETGTEAPGTVTSSTIFAISEDGGLVEHEGMEMNIPAGALTEEIEITVNTIAGGVAGYETYPQRYLFEPDGRVFETAVEITIPFDGTEGEATLFWSGPDASGYQRLDSTVSGSTLVGRVTHLSEGFVASGIDYDDDINVADGDESVRIPGLWR
ncbi:MAG: hypothetical protein ACJAZO_004774 [Myxococcota bacterium]|jgi:hypothetical protein